MSITFSLIQQSADLFIIVTHYIVQWIHRLLVDALDVKFLSLGVFYHLETLSNVVSKEIVDILIVNLEIAELNNVFVVGFLLVYLLKEVEHAVKNDADAVELLSLDTLHYWIGG
jgi:hypothetical protein